MTTFSTSDRDRHVHTIFRRSLDIEPERRRSFIRQECGTDAALVSEVEELLDLVGDDDGPLDKPMLGSREGSGPFSAPEIEGYRIESVIGSGGMGTVYLAEQQRPRRHVALKALRSDLASSSALRRFEYESDILARLDHPGIAHVFEAGTFEDRGRRIPYFAMERVEGARSITAYVRVNELDVRERMAIFASVCDAVNYGHQHGVIHRDLKPANILVDESGRSKIIDFGVARNTAADRVAGRRETRAGDLLGTVQYMSPEQCGANPDAIDVRCDVYALGLVLYELLCTQLPYDLTGLGIGEAVRVICDEPPTRPTQLDPELRGDVEAILLKALEKNPDRRYQSAAGLARDVRRYLDHEPVEARSTTAFYQLRLLARRHRTSFITGAVLAGVLVVATAVSLAFGIAASRESARRATAEQLANAARASALEERDEARWQAYVGCIASADAALQAGEALQARKRLAAAPSEHRGWEWTFLNAMADRSSAVLGDHAQRVTAVDFSPDGAWLASASVDGTARIRDAKTGRTEHVLEDGARVTGLAFSPDGRTVATVGDSRVARLWDVRTGAPVRTLPPADTALRTVAWSPDGSHLVTVDTRGGVRVRNPQTGDLVTTWNAMSGNTPSLICDARGRVFIGATGGPITAWRLLDGERLMELTGHESVVRSLALGPKGSTLYSASGDGSVRVWDTSTGETRGALDFGDSCTAWSVTVSRDGTRVAAGLGDQTVQLWNADGEPLARLTGHHAEITDVAFDPAGTMLASASYDYTVRLWDVDEVTRQPVLAGHGSTVQAIAFSPDGRLVATGARDDEVHVRDAATREVVARLPDHGGTAWSLAFSPDSSLLASGTADGRIHLWDAHSFEHLGVLEGHTSKVYGLAFSPDGARIASGSRDHTLRIWDHASRTEIARHDDHSDFVWAVAYSPDGRWLATGSWDRTVALRDPDTGHRLYTFEGHIDSVYALAFSPDSRMLASGGRGLRIGIWDLETREGRFLDGHGQFVVGLAFSPDGTRLASASWFRNIKLWEVPTLTDVATLRPPPRRRSNAGEAAQSFRCVAFSTDGSTIAAGCSSSNVRLWKCGPSTKSETPVTEPETGGQNGTGMTRAERHHEKTTGTGRRYPHSEPPRWRQP